MASAVFLEGEFTCSVCLETLQDPATLPCGHTYCLPCIQKHWDKGEAKQVYSCPQCRQTFTPRPTLARSTLLVEAMEKLKARGSHEAAPFSISSAPPSLPFPPGGMTDTQPHEGGIYPQLPVSPWICPQHQHPLELFCRDDQEPVCTACRDHKHKDHRVVTAEAERTERQRELVRMQADTQRRIQEREQRLQLLPQAARDHKGSLQSLQREAGQFFAELQCSIELMGKQVQELLCAREAAAGSNSEGQIHRLEQELAQLRRMDEELRRLAQIQDHVCFLKNFLTLGAPFPDGGEGIMEANPEVSMVGGVRAVLEQLKDQHQELCKASLARIFRTVNDSSALAQMPMASEREVERLQGGGGAEHRAEPTSQPTVNEVAPNLLHNPEPKTRDELLKFRFEPTLDPNTAYRHLRLSEEGRKAILRAETQAYPEHPDRFLFWRQVLCRESLAGSPYYWEVEWSGQKVTIGVAYAGMGRKGSDDSCRLGHNDQSWALYWSGTGFSLWHNGKETAVPGAKARRVGVYLDQQVGVLAFYSVAHNQAQLLHQVQTQFSGPLYPGFRFWTGVGATVTVCQLD